MRRALELEDRTDAFFITGELGRVKALFTVTWLCATCSEQLTYCSDKARQDTGSSS
jgi:hypothetical protein